MPWSDPEPACFHKGGFDFKIQESEITIPNAITDSLLIENNILLGTFDSFPLKLLRIDFWSLESTPPYSPFKSTCFCQNIIFLPPFSLCFFFLFFRCLSFLPLTNHEPSRPFLNAPTPPHNEISPPKFVCCPATLRLSRALS